MLNFDYTLTESSIAAPFNCICGSHECKLKVGLIWVIESVLKLVKMLENN